MAVNISSGCNNVINFDNGLLYFTIPLSVIVCCESVLIIHIIWRTPELHTNSHVLVASLSTIDLLIGIFYIVNGVTSVLELRPSSPEPNIIANFVMGTNFGSVFISVIHMGIIAIDRCIYISDPFYHLNNATKKRILTTLLCIWIIGLAYTAVPMIVYTDAKYHEKCIQLNPPLEYYSILAFVYLISVVVVFVCYFKIAHVYFKHKKAAIARRLQFDAPEDGALFTHSRVAAMRSVKFFAVVFGLFAVCNFPLIFTTALNYIYAVPQNIFIPLTYLMPISSVINFMLYAYMCRDFNQALYKNYVNIKKCCCKLNRATGSS